MSQKKIQDYMRITRNPTRNNVKRQKLTTDVVAEPQPVLQSPPIAARTRRGKAQTPQITTAISNPSQIEKKPKSKANASKSKPAQTKSQTLTNNDDTKSPVDEKSIPLIAAKDICLQEKGNLKRDKPSDLEAPLKSVPLISAPKQPKLPDNEKPETAKVIKPIATKSATKSVTKKALKNVSSLADLRAQLASFSKKKVELETIKEKQSVLTKELKANDERTERKTAKEKFKHLHLLELFESVEDVVYLLGKRQRICTFSAIKAALQKMRKSIEQEDLGRIKTVCPDAYLFRQEKVTDPITKKSSFQLTLDANLGAEYKDGMTPALAAQRKGTFRQELINIVRPYHRAFLEQEQIPLDEERLKNWHVDFKLDDVLDVAVAELPKPPDVKVITSAQQALEEVKSTFSPKYRKALQVAASLTQIAEEKQNSVAKVTSFGSGDGMKKGSSVLERIRAKEAAMKEYNMIRNSESAGRAAMIGRLPDLVRILRSAMVTEKKIALSLDDAVTKMADSYKTTMGLVEAEKHLKLMEELLPEWLSIHTTKNGKFVKIQKNLEMKILHSKLDKLRKENKV